MTTHAPFELEPVQAASDGRSFAARRWKELLAVWLVLLGVVLGLVWFGERGAERRALESMAPEERRALYAETFRNAKAVCEHARRDRELSDRCEDAITFLRMFPECDEGCRALSEAYGRGATR